MGRTQLAKITDRFLRDLAPPEIGYVLERDDDLPGFGVRRTATGCTAFIFNYVLYGRERRMTLGRYPTWSVAAARDEAKRLRRMVDRGDDPLATRDTARAEPTLAKLWEQYSAIVLPKKAPSTRRNEIAIWARHVLPRLGRMRLSEIGSASIERLHIELSTTPVLANRCLASVRHVFSAACRWGYLDRNPAAMVKKNHEHRRERFLTNDEYRRFLAALDKRVDTSSTLAIRFLLQTGARRGEVLSATWEQIDLDSGTWVKPSSHTKQRRIHRVPLSLPAIDTLRRARCLSNGPFVFPGKAGGALAEIKKMFAYVLRDAGITGFRLHDLRHSFASFLVADGASLPIIGQLLGHTQVATTQRYAHLQDAQLREATNRIWDVIR